MTNRRATHNEPGAEHESTWGANELVKQEWQDSRADKVRKEIERENEAARKQQEEK